MKYLCVIVMSLALGMIMIFQDFLFSAEDYIELTKTGHRKPVIVFSHGAHSRDYDNKCVDCHHTGEQVKCSFCHKYRDQGKIINMKGAFHQQCHECHSKKSGPKACGRCHKK
ncbi:MAG: cytochrome c3 family protein [Spirochaetes bacterium]|nr:cytochrome c3 family protein [Spirochaetota bacterium]